MHITLRVFLTFSVYKKKMIQKLNYFYCGLPADVFIQTHKFRTLKKFSGLNLTISCLTDKHITNIAHSGNVPLYFSCCM